MKNNNQTLSLKFLLDVDDDGWPPVSSENLLAKQICDEKYEILVAPFFIQNLSAGDVIRVEFDEDGVVQNWKIKVESKRSTVWVLCNDFSQIDFTLERLKKHGCNVERLKQFGLIVLDVPEIINSELLEQCLSEIESKGANVACPSFRH